MENGRREKDLIWLGIYYHFVDCLFLCVRILKRWVIRENILSHIFKWAEENYTVIAMGRIVLPVKPTHCKLPQPEQARFMSVMVLCVSSGHLKICVCGTTKKGHLYNRETGNPWFWNVTWNFKKYVSDC